MTDLETYQPRAELAIPPAHDIDSWIAVASDVIKIAKVIYDTPFVPEGLRGSEPAVAAAILAGREMGLGPMTSLQHIHVIKGKPGQSALLMRALIEAQGHKWEDGDVSDVRAVVRGCRKGEAKWTEVTFTAAQAKTAGIDLGKYPQDKLYARATVRLARRKFADVIMGMPYSAEELEDGDTDEGTVTEAASNGHAPDPPKPASRTAQRRGRTTPNVPSAVAPAPPAHAAPPGPPAEGTLPPLPGEDEPDAGRHAQDADAEAPQSPPATTGQVGIIQSHFKRLGYDETADRAERLDITAILAGHDGDLGSTKELTQVQGLAVADTLSRCKDRERLITLLADGDKPGGSDG